MLPTQTSPGFIRLLLGALFGVVIGFLLAVIHLVDRPVEVVKTLPKEPTPGVIYYEQPAQVSLTAWQNKKAQLETPGNLTVLTETELASLLAHGLMTELRKNQPPPDPNAKTMDLPETIARGLGLRILPDNTLMIGIQVETRRLGGPRPLVLKTEGSFEKVTLGWVYRPRVARLGGLDLNRMPGGRPIMAIIGRTLTPEILRKARTIEIARGAASIELLP